MTRRSKHTSYKLQIGLVMTLVLLCPCAKAVAQNSAPNGPSAQYELETIEIRGTTRITDSQLREQLRIKDHTIMTDEWMIDARTKLLGLGIFKDVFFSLKKGTKPGLAKLILKAEDDEHVLSDWAVGGEFGLSLTEPYPAFGDDSVFRGYKFGLIARNILRESHRGAIIGDIDSRGNLVYGQLAYGLPRFVSEAIQFDSAVTVVEPRERYFETEGYGLKIQSMWTRQRKGIDVTYGAAWYSNTHTRYRLDGWPEVVAGPKIGLQKETRFLGFFPAPGYRAALSLMPSLVHRNEAIVESELAGTIMPWNLAALTLTGKTITTGNKAITTRAEAKIEIPITSSNQGLRSQFYIAVRNGLDRYQDQKIAGTESVAGFRYHSTGFIGDVSFRIVGEHPWKKNPIGPKP